MEKGPPNDNYEHHQAFSVKGIDSSFQILVVQLEKWNAIQFVGLWSTEVVVGLFQASRRGYSGRIHLSCGEKLTLLVLHLQRGNQLLSFLLRKFGLYRIRGSRAGVTSKASRSFLLFLVL